ncbi:hypothetical protein GCM10007937_29880 [Mesorhizobium albiziae]|nr:hypothetical protein GCM10007937_29880 [Mesorhizobium albiziae]
MRKVPDIGRVEPLPWVTVKGERTGPSDRSVDALSGVPEDVCLIIGAVLRHRFAISADEVRMTRPQLISAVGPSDAILQLKS